MQYAQSEFCCCLKTQIIFISDTLVDFYIRRIMFFFVTLEIDSAKFYFFNAM